MIPRVLLNNIQYIKKFILVSVCFYLVEHFPHVDRLRIVIANDQNKSAVHVTKQEVRTSTVTHATENDKEIVSTTNMMDEEDSHLILLWTEYQMIGKDIYQTIFKRITDNQCPVSNCRWGNI